MGFRGHFGKKLFLEANPHTHAIKLTQQAVVISPTPPEAPSQEIKRHSWNQDQISATFHLGKMDCGLKKRKRPRLQMRTYFDMMQPQPLTINAGKKQLFLLWPRAKNIRLRRYGTENTGRTRLQPMRPCVKKAADFCRLQRLQLRRQITKNTPHLHPQALLFVSVHRK